MRLMLMGVCLLTSSFCIAAIPLCDKQFKQLLSSKNYTLIKRHLGPGELSSSGPLYIWKKGGFILIAGRIGRDLGMMINPTNKYPPKLFAEAINNRDVRDTKKLVKLLGQPNAKRKIGYYRWRCLNNNNQAQDYYLTIDSKGIIYFDDFSYPPPTTMGRVDSK